LDVSSEAGYTDDRDPEHFNRTGYDGVSL